MGTERSPGVRIADDYQLVRLIGRGGMGEVWEALQARTGQRVALKFLPGVAGADQKARFAQEAKALGALKSPYVVQVFHILDDGDEPVIVMELLEGESLAARFARERTLPLFELCGILIQVVAALRAAHKRGVIHRDLKPDNVFLAASEGGITAKLIDFGIARLPRQAGGGEEGPANDAARRQRTGPEEQGLTRAGEVLGTTEYMSPEQAFGDDDVDARSDVWSLGVMAYFLLSSGVSATRGPDTHQTFENITQRPIRPLGEVTQRVPRDLAEMVDRMLSVEREARPTLEAVEAVLVRCRNAETAPAPRVRSGRLLSRALAGIAMMAIIAIMALLLETLWATPAPQEGPPAPPVESALAPPAPSVPTAKVAPEVSPVPPLPPSPCPTGMAYIPGDTFTMGSPKGEGIADEHPPHQVRMSAFCLDKTEVTVAAYRECVAKERNGTKCTPTSTTIEWRGVSDEEDIYLYSVSCNLDKDAHPVNCVNWFQANTYCIWSGGYLPTEAQWEYAAKGAVGRRYPWGDTAPAGQLCWNGDGSDIGKGKRRGTCPADSYPAGASPFVVLGMAGNVWEWVADWYGPYTDSKPQPVDPKGPPKPVGEPRRVLRGGGWVDGDPSYFRASNRFPVAPMSRTGLIGFRCARETG